jgi:hypothetical protein
MATWRGNEIPPRPQIEQPRSPDLLPEDFDPFPDAEPDYNPKPGQKHYDPRNQMARRYADGGEVAPAPPTDWDAIRTGVTQRFPRLQDALSGTQLQWGDPAKSGGNQLESYPADESDNPNPGQRTIEVYKGSLQGDRLVNAVAGDLLHHLGSVDRVTGQPVDPTWHGMKQAFIDTLTPQQMKVDLQAYKQDQAQGETRTIDDWMQNSRSDAYLRGYLTPDENNEWKDVYTPNQKQMLDGMRQYLKSYRRGGIAQRYAAGGPVVRPEPEDVDVDDPYSARRGPYRPQEGETMLHRGPDEYLPGNTPYQKGMEDWPKSDTYEEVDPQWMRPDPEPEPEPEPEPPPERTDDKISRLMDNPEHGSWHEDGKFQIYTPNPSMFANVDPRDFVKFFDKYHPADHKLNLP